MSSFKTLTRALISYQDQPALKPLQQIANAVRVAMVPPDLPIANTVRPGVPGSAMSEAQRGAMFAKLGGGSRGGGSSSPGKKNVRNHIAPLEMPKLAQKPLGTKKASTSGGFIPQAAVIPQQGQTGTPKGPQWDNYKDRIGAALAQGAHMGAATREGQWVKMPGQGMTLIPAPQQPSQKMPSPPAGAPWMPMVQMPGVPTPPIGDWRTITRPGQPSSKIKDMAEGGSGHRQEIARASKFRTSPGYAHLGTTIGLTP